MFETCKNTHNLISHQNSRFHCFLMTFSQKTTIETQKWWPFQIIFTFLFIHLLPFRRSCYMYETCKNTQIELQHFCSPKKVVPTVFARYNREQLGKYTGKLIVTIDPGIRVWYGMVWWFTRKMAKPVKGHHFQHYKHITRLFPYYFPIISLVVPYYFLLFPIISIICFYYLPIISLLVPYFCPIISLYIYIISLFYPMIVPYASQVSKMINLDT